MNFELNTSICTPAENTLRHQFLIHTILIFHNTLYTYTERTMVRFKNPSKPYRSLISHFPPQILFYLFHVPEDTRLLF